MDYPAELIRPEPPGFRSRHGADLNRITESDRYQTHVSAILPGWRPTTTRVIWMVELGCWRTQPRLVRSLLQPFEPIGNAFDAVFDHIVMLCPGVKFGQVVGQLRVDTGGPFDGVTELGWIGCGQGDHWY